MTPLSPHALWKILVLPIGLAFLGSARADTWAIPGDTCAVNVPSPQVFSYSNPTGGGNRIYSVTSSGIYQNIVPTTSVKGGGELACAAIAATGQVLVVYRDTTNNVKSRDRLSGWQEVALGITAVGQGLFATSAFDAGKNKVVLFAAETTNGITMSVWDDTVTPKWSTPVFLAAVPGGMSVTAEHRLTGYSVMVGASPYQALASVFVVSDDGHLRENKGPLVGARTWIDHGLAPGNQAFSSLIQFGPSATGIYGSPTGHPGTYSESEYARRISVPTAGQGAIFSRVADVNVGTFYWTQIAGSTTTPPFALNLASGAVRGCTGIGEPCAQATLTLGRFVVSGGLSQFAAFYSGTTDTSPPGSVGWTVLPPTTPTQATPAVTAASGTNRGIMFYIDSANNMISMNLDTFAITNLGHP